MFPGHGAWLWALIDRSLLIEHERKKFWRTLTRKNCLQDEKKKSEKVLKSLIFKYTSGRLSDKEVRWWLRNLVVATYCGPNTSTEFLEVFAIGFQ